VAGTLVKDPVDLIIHNKENRLIARIETILQQFPGIQRFGMCLGILFFDRAPFIFGFGIRRFVNLQEEERKRYVASWSHTHSTLLHELFKGIRGLVLVCYFSHTDIWNYIGYTPHQYVGERIQLRRNLTGETIPDLAKPMDESEQIL
jgi:hypothetical protein